MKQNRLVLIVIALALAGTVNARKLTVNVRLGANSSRSSFACYLYQNGAAFACAPVRKTGTNIGEAVFDVPTKSYYQAAIKRAYDGAWAWSENRYFQPYFAWMNLSASF